MRNLKKVLSLVLALAMMLSMMAFASAAEKKTITSADLTDMDQVQNKAAVSLLVDLGIINGIEQEDGTFKYEPAMGINRASWAKLVYYVMTGEADASAYKGLDLGMKDVAGHWAEGEIAYCVANKIAAGDLEKNFHPDADITVVGAAKMLLTALGYDATLSKYENDQLWSLNIMNDAKKAGLMAGVTQTASEVLSRDNAALMVYNALNAYPVTPSVQYDMGVAYLNGYIEDNDTLGELNYGLKKYTGVVTNLTGGKAVVSGVPGSVPAAAYNFFAGSNELLGQTVSFFVQEVNGTYVKTWSSALIPDGSSLIHTSTNGTTVANLTTKAPGNRDFVAEPDGTVLYFNNGAPVANLTGVDTVKGNVIELYDTDANGKVDLVKATVKTVVTLAADPKVETAPDGKVSVTITVIPTAPGTTFVGYEGLKKDDVVLYYTVDGVVYLEKAEVVTGIATGANSDNEILVNGSYLSQSGVAGSATLTDPWIDFRGEYNFYLDNGGYVVDFASTTVAPPAQYLYVLDAGWVDGGGGVTSTQYMEAQVLLADGTTEIVTIKSAKDAANNAITLEDTTASVNAVKAAAFWSYTVDKDGKYSLVQQTVTSIGSQTVSGKVQFSSEVTANAKTVFLVDLPGAVPGTRTYTVHTGYANLPTLSGATGVAMVDTGMATLVYLNATGIVGVTTGMDNVYLLDPDTFTYVVENSQVVAISTKAIDDGKVIDLLVDAADATALKALNTGLYNIAGVGEDGIVSVANMTELTSALGIGTVAPGSLSMANGVVKSADGSSAYSYNADTVLYYIDSGRGTVSEMAVDAFVAEANATYTLYILNAHPVNAEHAKEIYIIK